MKYEWTTAKGSKVELDISTKIITERVNNLDGWEYTVPCHEWMYTINSLLVNGVERKAGAHRHEFGRFPGPRRVAYEFYLPVDGKKQRALVEIPPEIEEAIYGEERAYFMAKFEKEQAIEEAYQKHHDAVQRMLDL